MLMQALVNCVFFEEHENRKFGLYIRFFTLKLCNILGV
jgi:hypothetical protein